MLSLSIVPYVIWEAKENRPVLFVTWHVKQLNVPVHSFAVLNSWST